MFRTPVDEIGSSNQYAWALRQSLQDAYELVHKNLKTASYRLKDFYAEEFMGNFMRLVI